MPALRDGVDAAGRPAEGVPPLQVVQLVEAAEEEGTPEVRRAAYDYGDYERLFQRKTLALAFRRLNEASAATGVRYYLLGGAAVYLHTKNAPVDQPDVDMILDTDLGGGRRFVRALMRKGFRFDFGDESDDDVFARLTYLGIEFDIFTDQSERPHLGVPVRIGGVNVRRIEGLIVEKMVRASYPDLLMAIDLLQKRHDRRLVRDMARKYRSLSRLLFMERIASLLKRGRATAEQVRRWARKMAGTGSLSHF